MIIYYHEGLLISTFRFQTCLITIAHKHVYCYLPLAPSHKGSSCAPHILGKGRQLLYPQAIYLLAA